MLGANKRRPSFGLFATIMAVMLRQNEILEVTGYVLSSPAW